MQILRRALMLTAAVAMSLTVWAAPAAGANLFGTVIDYPAGQQPYALAAADLNGDGILDLVATDLPPSVVRSTVAVLLGNGDGSFKAPVFYTVGPEPLSVAVADFNGDGKLDLAVASPKFLSSQNAAVSVLLGNGDGTFQAAVNYPAGEDPVFVLASDFSGDGKLDFSAANAFGSVLPLGYVGIAKGNGDGTFQKPLDLKAGKVPVGLAVGDFNKDGKPDLAVANICSLPQGCKQGAVSVMLGKGDGTFQKAITTTISAAAYFVAAADLNGDGNVDLVAAEYLAGRVAVLLGNGDGTFKPPMDLTVGNGPDCVAITDLNGDGSLDLAVVNYGGGNLTVLLGNGDGTFGTSMTVDLGGGALPAYVAVGDFNGDQRPDLAVTKNNGYVSILLNMGQ